MKIKKQLIKDTPYKNGKSNGKKYITIHMTDNWREGANAQAHANLQSNGNTRNAAWHWQVDDKQAIQSFDHKFQLWHAGDGGGSGNNHSIAIEGCVNSDGSYVDMIENMAKLTRHIMEMENIKIQNVVQHNHWSGKNCPSDLRSGKHGITWNDFIKLVKGSASALVVEPNKGKTIDQLVKETLAGKHGNGEQRKKSLGKNYTKVQNIINKMYAKAKPKPNKSIDQLVKETLAGKHGNGEQRKKSLGKNYHEVQSIINKMYAKAKPKPSKSIDQLVKETLAGKHGNGEQRKKSLGKNYHEVQSIINKMYMGGSGKSLG